jgi:hypothetical protein
MDQPTTAGPCGLSRSLNPVVYVAKCWVPAAPLDWFSLTQKRSKELRLGITVETTENREGGCQAVQAPLRSVRAGSVSQRSSTGMGGHQRSPTVRRNRRSGALRLKQLG